MCTIFPLSAREIDRLVPGNTIGRLCGRYYQRADGTMLAQNCPVALRAMLRWTSHAAAAVMAALVSVSPAFAKPFPQQANSSLTQIHPAKKVCLWYSSILPVREFLI
jgi:hypothetical protein